MTTQRTTDAIWTRLNADLRRFIRRRVADDHVADDLLQETFVRVHHNLPSLRDTDRLAAWVYQVARNVIHDHHRQAAKATVSLADDPTAETEDHLSNLKSQVGEWLEEMIHRLPDGYREAVLLSEIEGLPQQEVADRLGLSLSGAKSRIQRGRMMLKDELERCCRFEFDRRGNVMDYERRSDREACRDCDEG